MTILFVPILVILVAPSLLSYELAGLDDYLIN